jgi:hypothetical protein
MRAYLSTAIVLLAIVAGCGSSEPQQNGNNGQPGIGMPAVPPDDISFDDGKEASNAYRKFFSDAVNHQSSGRWDVYNLSGAKQWTLSNTAYSAPKAWLLGGNYWNREDDTLNTKLFWIPDGSDGVRLTFTTRWRIGSGDSCSVYYWYSGASAPELVTALSGGQNPDYPGWTKYTFELPRIIQGGEGNHLVKFQFNSDTVWNDWGIAIDNVAVYQRCLEPPLNVSASDGLPGYIEISWDHNPAGNLLPDSYKVYRRDRNQDWILHEVGTVDYPATSLVDSLYDPEIPYTYLVQSVKAGWSNSAPSNEDTGWHWGW